MLIRKDQVLKQGRFNPDKNTIYLCSVNNTSGLLKDISIFTVLIGFFAFILLDWLSLIIVPLSWILILWFVLPKHYRFIQLEKHLVILGTGTLLSLIRKRRIVALEKHHYNKISSIRFERWERRKKKGIKDTFGTIEINVGEGKPPFSILISAADLIRLVEYFEKYRFDIKVQKSRTRGELLLIFPSSPLFNSSA
ncbi:MAG: hypothetical protein ACFFAJ_04355 [Candidatus Hodarchaeota archaeon]